MMVFIALQNNDESYEDYKEWTSGVFSSLELAEEYINSDSFGGFDCVILPWSVDTKESAGELYYERKSLNTAWRCITSESYRAKFTTRKE